MTLQFGVKTDQCDTPRNTGAHAAAAAPVGPTHSRSSWVPISSKLQPAAVRRFASFISSVAAKTRFWWYVMPQMPEELLPLFM